MWIWQISKYKNVQNYEYEKRMNNFVSIIVTFLWIVFCAVLSYFVKVSKSRLAI